VLNEKLLDVAEGRCTRLIITMPPRHGKSECTSKYFPAWYLGVYPHKRVILASYAAEFAEEWGGKARDLLEYHGERLFGITIKHNSKAAARWVISDAEGGMQTCGVGGPLTGKGADLLIIDDPVKNAEEANSEVIRQKTWEWFTSTAYTRLEPGGAAIIIQTRWHEDDLTGRVLTHAKETGDRWELINFPAIAEPGDELGRKPGEPLWPGRYDLPALAERKRMLGSYQFSALYQQSPVPPEGALFKREWFRYYTLDGDFYRLGSGGGLVRGIHCRRFGTMDLAFSLKKEADYTVICAWAVTPKADLLLLDMVRARMDAPEFPKQIKRMVEEHGLDYLGIEKMLGTSMVAHGVRQDGLAIRMLIADKDKITRSLPAQIRMENGQVYMPLTHPDRETIEHELMTFPHGTHDDIVDNFSYAAEDVQRWGSPGRSTDLSNIREEAEKMLEDDRRKQADLDAQANWEDERWWNDQ
jgi:predicted phage terminase large subunit-like protein